MAECADAANFAAAQPAWVGESRCLRRSLGALTCVTDKGGWGDRSEVSCPAYGFQSGGRVRERSGAEGYSSQKQTGTKLYTYQEIRGNSSTYRLRGA